MRSIVKTIFILISLVFLIIGQMLILNAHNYKGAIILSSFFILFLFAGLTEIYLIIWKKTTAAAHTTVEIIKNFNTARKSKTKEIKGQSQSKSVKKEKQIETDQYIHLKIAIPKVIFIIIAGLFAVIAQVFLLSQNFKIFTAVLFIALFFFAIFLKMREKKEIYKLKLRKGLFLAALISGILLIIGGWILLVNYKVIIQEWGVFLTLIGVLFVFFGLPENEEVDYLKETESVILFEEYKILNNYIVKAALILAAFILVKIGDRLLHSQNLNMIAWCLYLAGWICVFFALPLINFKEKYYDNKILNIIKLAAVLIAVYIAYMAQKSFVSNNVVHAVHLYFISAFIFIFAVPTYSKEEEEDIKIPKYFEVIYLMAVTGAGVFLRLYELSIRPFGVENDEAGGFLGHLIDVMQGKIEYNVGNNGIQYNVMNLFVHIFGANRIGMKMLGVAVGLLAIPAVYFFIKKAINTKAAMFVTGVYTTLRIILHYSRSGHGTLLTTLAIPAALFFLLNAMKKKDKTNYFLSGFCMGLGWHSLMTVWLISLVPFIYWIIKSFTTKAYFKRNLIGILSFCLGFWFFTSMMIHNYFLSTNMYFSRIHEVSVFSNDYNAPNKNIGAGIMDNTKRVLLMFNYQGDARERNSGGRPFDPTIDFFSAMFFMIGLIYCSYYARHYLFFIFILIFYSQAAGSIFSVEAPSAMRAFGTIISVLFFIGIIFDRIWAAFSRVLNKPLRAAIFPIMLFIPLFFIAKENYNQYFNRWIGGLDELSTAAGMYSQELGKSYRVFLATSQYYPGHPPYKFFRDYKVNHSPDGLDIIRDMSLINDENYAVLFHSDLWNVLPYWKNKFPNAKTESITHRHFFNKMKSDSEGFGKFFDSFIISNAEIQAIRGLRGTYAYKNGKTEIINNDSLEFGKDKADNTPYRVKWEGDVFIPLYGDSSFLAIGHSDAKLFIDNKKIDLGKTYKFSKGLHKIKVEATRESANDTFGLSLNVKRLEGSRVTGEENYNITKSYLYENFLDGLHGYYYTGKQWDKAPIVREENNPYLWFTSFLLEYFPSSKWQGTLKIKKDGQYKITASNNGYLRIVIDKKFYWDSGDDNDAKDYFKDKNMQKTTFFNLKKGKHFIQIYSVNASIIQISWDEGENVSTPLGGDMLEPDYLISE